MAGILQKEPIELARWIFQIPVVPQPRDVHAGEDFLIDDALHTRCAAPAALGDDSRPIFGRAFQAVDAGLATDPLGLKRNNSARRAHRSSTRQADRLPCTVGKADSGVYFGGAELCWDRIHGRGKPVIQAHQPTMGLTRPWDSTSSPDAASSCRPSPPVAATPHAHR